MNLHEDLGDNQCNLHWVEDECYTADGSLIGEVRSFLEPANTAEEAVFLAKKKDHPTIDSVLWKINQLARDGKWSLFLMDLQSDVAEGLKQLLESRKFECYMEKGDKSPGFPCGKCNLSIFWGHVV